ncbi:hypothetical protein FACS189418_5820 [Clostridia bacterium]|nr:hypothetical protein FACS189418_5820 [Clostridia bacterium]
MNRAEQIFMAALFFGAYRDIRKQSLPLWYLIVTAITAVVAQILWNTESWLSLLGGVGIGFIGVAFSYFSAGKFGLGDGIFLCLSGLYLGFSKNLYLLAMGLFFSTMFAMGCFIVTKNNKKKFPFLPFLLLSDFWLILGRIYL